MKKFFTFFSLLLTFALGVKAQTTTWDFTASNPTWTATGIGVSAVFVDPQGLGLYDGGTATGNFGAWQGAQSASSWSAPNDAYAAATVRVQTNGAGFAATGVEATPTQRYFFIQVDQACTVKVWFKSGSSSAARSVIASDGTTEYGKATSILTATTGFPTSGGFLSASITKAGTFYLYGDAAVNIYQIQVVGATVSLTPVNPLPVTFTNVSASLANGIANIGWSVGLETNTASYSIERSQDGSTFTSIGSVTVKATNAKNYGWDDNAPASGINYYRIKAIDQNGTITYSSIVKVAAGNKLQEIVVAPNPVKGKNLILQLNNLSKGNYVVNILNNAGQKVYTNSVSHVGGNSVQSLLLPASVGKGLYNVHVTNGAISFNKTIIVE